MTSRTQQHRTETTNTPPPNGSLLPGELYVELADPVKLWAGVPAAILPAGVKLLYDSTSAGVALNKTGDTATGTINFNAGINVTNTPASAPVAAQDTNTNQIATTSYVLNQADTTTPLMDGAAAPGTRTRWSRGDHVHPTDTTRAPLASPTFTGTPTLTTTPPVDDNTLKVADTAYVIGQAATVTPLMDGPATPGTSLRYARADHVHPPDTTRGTVTVSDVPPASPNAGSFWFDSVGVQLYLFYVDPTGPGQWVPVNNQALAGFLALTGGIMQGPLTLAGPATAANQPATLAQLHTLPTVQRFTSGSGTYTPAVGVAWIRVRMVGGGGGGGGAVGGTNGGNAGNTTFGGWVAQGGLGGGGGVAPPASSGGGSGGGAGTSGSNGTGTLVVRLCGGQGSVGSAPTPTGSNFTGTYPYGGGSVWGALTAYGTVPGGASPSAGSGGPGASSNNGGATGGGGGGGGEYAEFLVNAPAATAYAVGTGGAAGTGSLNGFAGNPGIIVVEEHY